MQRLLFIVLIFILLDGCRMLGIGKQCYTCTTTVSKGGTSSSSSKEVCGADEMKEQIKNSGTLVGGYYTTVNCVEK